MRKIYIVLLCMFFLVLISINTSAAEVQAYNLGIKEISQDSFIWFSVKVDISNDEIPGSIFVRIQGLDSDGFEITTILLRGEFASNEQRTLTRKDYMDPAEYASVVTWTIKSIDKYPDR